MRRLHLFFVMSIAAGGLHSDAAPSPIRLTLALDPPETIPCVPVTFRVTAINTSKQPANLPSVVRLEVTPASGETFIPFEEATSFRGAEPFPFEYESEDLPRSIQLAPGEKRSFDFISAAGSPPWFGDSRFVQPGAYHLQLFTDEGLQRGDLAWVDPIRSNEAVLTIAEPSGVDGSVWDLVKDRREPCRALGEHRAEIWGQYSDWSYTGMLPPPSLVGPRPDVQSLLEAFQTQLTKRIPEGYADGLKLAIAEIHLRLMHDALGDQNVQEAFERSETARAILEELAYKETAFEIKQQAKQKLLDAVKTRIDLQDAVDRLRGLARNDCERVGYLSMREEIASFAAGPAVPRKEKDRLDKVTESLDQYEEKLKASPSDTDGALHALEKAAGELEKLFEEEGLIGEYVRKWALFVAGGSEYSVRKSVELAAQDPAVDRKKLEQAQKALDAGHAAQENKDYRKAVSWYRDALKKAEQASKVRRVPC